MTTEASRTLFGEQIKDICDQMGVEKSEAFPRWICQNILGITGEGDIDEAVSIGGKNDYGVDIFYADETGDITEQYVCWIQAKFGEDLDRTAKREDLESFASTLGHLRDCPDSANQTFKQKSAEFARMEAQYPHIKKRMIFAVTGRLNEQSREMVSNPRWLEEKFGVGGGGRDANVDFEVLDLDEILSRMTIRHTPTLSVRFDGDVITRIDPATGKKSVIGYVAADDLVRMAAEHRETIFLENPRQTLGKGVPTHKAILNTLEDADGRKKFWKLNNGITAICTGLEAAGDGTYMIENFKVVNGRQTTYTLENYTGSRDGVYLLMIVHEAVDDTERNEISEATNTQNPIKPVDLVTNYPEMTDLVLQCRSSFCDFYFERQTKGFKSAKKSTQNRVTWRRVLEKSAVARAYYAYEIDPNEAMLPDKILFSVTGNGGGGSSHYDRIFRNRDIADLIIPHIFMSMLEGLHRRWCAELKGRQSGEISRSKGIISKDIVKYYLLHFIYKSMLSIDESERQRIKGRLIETFRSLGRRDGDPDVFQSIAKSAYDIFMLCFDTERRETWPPALLEKIGSDRYEADERDVPTPYDIMHMLRHNGPKIILDLLRARDHQIKQVGDNVRAELLKL